MLTVFQKYMQELLQDIFTRYFSLKNTAADEAESIHQKKKDRAVAQSLSVINVVSFYQ